jgi:hypothetical protein
LSNSNKSLLAILMGLEFGFDAAYVDRLPDFPPPHGCACFFEDLHGARDVAEYESRLRALAEQHHGWAGWYYGKQFERALNADSEELKAFITTAREEYRQAAAGITSGWRDLVRLHGRFATIYASGCLARRFDVLPLPRAELLAADLASARDHVAFVEQEVRRLGVPVSPAHASEVVAVGSAGQPPAYTEAPAVTPFDRLRCFINAGNKSKNFLDLRAPGLSRLRFQLKLRAQQKQNMRAPVFVGQHDGQKEYLFPSDRFEEIAGSARDALALKKKLFGRGLIETTQRGHSVSYVVKRSLPDGSRPFFVIIRDRAKRA